MKKLDQYSPSIPAESNFAYGLLKNETAPSAGDGTAILAQHLQDLYYALYGVLQLAGEDPNETLEATNNKQFLGALSKIGIQRYNALNSYSQGMLAWSISLGAISVYISKTNSNVGNALSSTTHWQLVYSINMSGVVTFNNIAYDPTISGLTATSVKGAIDELAGKVGGVSIGQYVMIQDNLTGAEVPSSDNFIKLEAGLTGVGDYNEGKLSSESISGTAPLVIATATISDASSPMNGQTVNLIETEERFLRAGEAGRVQNDQMQRITGSFRAPRGLFIEVDGAFTLSEGTFAAYQGDGSSRHQGCDFDSANSSGARTSTATSGETRAKNIGVSVYMRIK